MTIPITKAVFDEADFAIIQEPLKSGWLVQGKFVKEFEDRFAEFIGADHAIAVTSCTTGLHISVAALGLKPGDEVLVPAFTWVSTANVVEHLGAKPIFVDVDLRTFNVDPAALATAVTDRTVGMIPVHLFGLAADMEPIIDAAERRGLWCLEDAACGFDSWYKGRHVGTFREVGAFSFHPRKAITTGEGGMITTNDASLATLSRTLRDHGASRTDFDRHHQQYSFLLAEYRHLGFNFRMTDIQGALGVTQLAKADRIQAGRRQCAEWYDELLAGVDWLQLPFRHPDYVHGQQSYVCLFTPEAPSLANETRMFDRRNRIMHALEQQGIVTRQGTHAPPFLDVFREKYGYKPADFPGAYMAERLSISLPVFAGMTAAEAERVASCLRAEFHRTL